MSEVFMGGLVVHNSPAKPSRKKPPKASLELAMHEVFSDEPSTVTRADVSPERKRKMKIAIAYSKVRKGE